MTHVWALCLLVLAIGAPGQCKGGEFPNWGARGLTRLLFGDIWNFEEFCGHSQTGSSKAQSDLHHQAFFNGSTLKSILNAEQSEDFQIAVNQAILAGVRARSSLSLVCSFSSWGYADESTRRLSSTGRDDPRKCISSLARILGSLKKLHNRMDNTVPVSDGHIISADDHEHIGPAIKWFEAGTGVSNNSIQDQCINCSRISNDWVQVSTFGRVNQGLPFDSHIWLGDYHACKRLPQTRYCFGALQSNKWTKTHGQGSEANYIRVGLCLPTECNPESSLHDMASMVDQIFNEHNPEIRASILSDGHLRRIYCPPEDDSPLRDPFGDVVSILLIIIGSVWICTILLVTLLRPCNREASFLARFDLRNNFISFFQSKPEKNGLAGLNFIKVLGIFWLISSHNLLLILPYLRNAQDFRQACNSSPVALLILQSQHVVVAFFLISGLLVGFKYLHRESDIGPTKMIVARYARLAPLYLLVYAFVKKFAHLMSSGPLWDYGVSAESETRQCMLESWLVPCLMLANFIPPFAHCILTGWHIANDFHLFLMVPWLLKVYRGSRNRGRLFVMASFIVSHLFHFWNFHQSDNFTFETIAQEPFTIGARVLMERLANDYVNPIGRFGTYFMGLLLADMVIERRANRKLAALIEANKMQELSMIQLDEAASSYRYKVSGHSAKPPGRSRVDRLSGQVFFMAAIISIVACLMGPALPMSVKTLLDPYSKTLTYPLTRLINELGWFYIIYQIVDNQDLPQPEPIYGKSSLLRPTRTSSLRRFIGLPVWNIAVKLNYTLVIIHFTVARYFVQSQTQLLEFSWPNLFQIIAFNALVTYCVAFIVHLAIEEPLMFMVRKVLVKFEIESKRPDGNRTSK